MNGREIRTMRAPRLLGWAPIAVYGLVLAALASCMTAPPRPGAISAPERIEAFPESELAIAGQVEVLWDEHFIPTIIASHEEDVPYALGLVHAHLRLTQMELVKRVARGRISESVGLPGNRIDHAIRALDLDRAVPEISSALPPETRDWLQRYADGVNDYRVAVPDRSTDFAALGFEDEPWTIEDSLALGRLASVDINWGRWLSLLPLRDETGYEDYLKRLESFAAAGIPSFGPSQPTALDPLLQTGKTGSNAFVVSGDRTESGLPIVACDPHLGLLQPNLWCIVGYRSPNGAAMGLTIPGMPFVLVGRNEHAAWVGTNMQNVASLLYDVSEEDPSSFTEREEQLKTRWWPDRTVTVRESAHGPVISDARLFRKLWDGPVAMRWNGHDASDEATAFLLAGRATSWGEFREAFATYGAGGQNMLFGDVNGNIGQLLATRWAPAATRAGLDGPVDPADPTYAWSEGLRSDRLPASVNPARGYIVSANNVPVLTDPPLLAQGNTNDRVERLSALLQDAESLTSDDALRLQLDTRSAQSLRAARAVLAVLPEPLPPETDELARVLRGWDGDYDADSRGAAAYVLTLHHLIDEGYEERYSRKLRRTLRSSGYVHAWIAEDAASGKIDAGAIMKAMGAASRDLGADKTWGDYHRTRLAHPLGMVPIFGRSYVFGEFPADGSSTTVYKSAHAITNEEHFTTFGANARFVVDLADPDANRVVLLGGQDGWMGSDRLLDQVDLWQAGEAISVPLREKSVRERAKWRTVIKPSAAPTFPHRPDRKEAEPISTVREEGAS